MRVAACSVAGRLRRFQLPAPHRTSCTAAGARPPADRMRMAVKQHGCLHEVTQTVHHICAVKPPAAATASAVLSSVSGIDRTAVEELIHIGAVHIGSVKLGAAAAKQQQQQQRQRQPQRAAGGPAAAAAAPPFQVDGLSRLASPDAPIARGTYLRLHAAPRRFARAAAADWRARVLHACADYVVIDKPAGVPSVPTTDNAADSALWRARAALGGDAARPLHAVSRLDVCTSGVLVFARSPAAAAALSGAISARAVRKVYRVVTTGAEVPLGVLRHCCSTRARTGDAQPRIYAPFDAAKACGDGSGWRLAELEVLSHDRGSGASTISLMTGRTHQIRLQLAALGAGIVGDSRYADIIGKVHDGTAASDRTDWFGPEPEEIRLHAAALEFDWGGERVCYTAEPPWA
ncbi:pseudouridine synthase [Tribonema minus]|uniref:Pseudouridine synthase n=1 Tax=Tribonema minus TaxID=303371 RepID=A0A835YKX4_9STRA|nr:pseudouridine synthase [Tribonema minus]